jgi:hypothetical protein
MDSRKCLIVIETVNAQLSHKDGLLIIVTRSLTLDESVFCRFTPSFFLAPQESENIMAIMFPIILHALYNLLHLVSLLIYVSSERLDYLWGSRNRLERSQISRPLSNDLIVHVHSEVGHELCFCLLDQLLLVLLKLQLFFSRQGFPSRLDDVAGTRQGSLLNRPLRADLIGPHVIYLMESRKSVLAPIRVPITAMSTGDSAICRGTNGPRPGVRRSAT